MLGCSLSEGIVGSFGGLEGAESSGEVEAGWEVERDGSSEANGAGRLGGVSSARTKLWIGLAMLRGFQVRRSKVVPRPRYKPT